MKELEKEEIEQERAGVGMAEADQIKRLTKHLTQVSLSHNSFWGAIACCRILCNYTVRETEKIYSVVAPNRAITKSDSEYARVRANLLGCIANRFGVKPREIVSSQSLSASDWRIPLIKECFERFEPKSGPAVPKAYSWEPSRPPLIPYDENDPRGDALVEVDRMGLLFSINNFNRIAKAQNLERFEGSLRCLNFWATPHHRISKVQPISPPIVALDESAELFVIVA